MDKNGFSNEINLPWIYLNLLSIDVRFKPQRSVLVRKTFQLKSIYFRFIWIYFQSLSFFYLKSLCAQ